MVFCAAFLCLSFACSELWEPKKLDLTCREAPQKFEGTEGHGDDNNPGNQWDSEQYVQSTVHSFECIRIMYSKIRIDLKVLCSKPVKIVKSNI